VLFIDKEGGCQFVFYDIRKGTVHGDHRNANVREDSI